MAIAKMKLINLITDESSLNEMLLRFVDLDCFHPEAAGRIAETVKGVATLEDEDPFTELFAQCKDMEVNMGLSLTNEPQKVHDVDLDQIRSDLSAVSARWEQIQTAKKDVRTDDRETTGA